MKIKIDIYLRRKSDNKLLQMLHEEITNDDLMEMLRDKWYKGDISIPINLNRDDISPEFSIDEVIV